MDHPSRLRASSCTLLLSFKNQPSLLSWGQEMPGCGRCLRSLPAQWEVGGTGRCWPKCMGVCPKGAASCPSQLLGTAVCLR